MPRTWSSASGPSLCVGAFLSCIPCAMAQEVASSAAPEAPDRIGAAFALVELLEESEQAQLMRDFNDPERHGWSFFPARRSSLRIGDLDDEERGALVDFLEVALGENGLNRVREVRAVEPITDRGGGVVTGPDECHLTFFGPISSSGPWGWRLEGHHIALNQTLVGSKLIAVTPSFLGSAPVRNEDGLEPLGREVRLARFSVEQLDGDLRDQVMEEDVPREIVTGMNVDWEQPRRQGASLAELPATIRQQLRLLARTHASVHADDAVRTFLASWDATDPAKIHFVWFGPLTEKGPHGYRLQGPEWVMEYVNHQGGANHVHTVWRTLEGEFIPIASR